ncbi:hypothetical protein F5887DRAFT_969295 [Amanita rubescens]|nr:hypothetical protein F5887DRAFT_969295 [Amanita rubescens]
MATLPTPPISPYPEQRRDGGWPGFLPGLPLTGASASDSTGPQTGPPRDRARGRVLILCFDGTGNRFGEDNSNVVRFFRALKKDNHDHQILYYQPGIGTYSENRLVTHSVGVVEGWIEFAFATHLDDHVKDGYKFLIQNYSPGDKICLFGFSRGAHTARVVAGMVYKVGILSRENLQQVDFAFNIYMTTGPYGYKLSREFKLTFASHVCIDFVGVWDTVASVGLIPRVHPYTSVNYSVKCFRHALALDERRAKFRPNMWAENTVNHEQELDVDFPIPEVDVDKKERIEWEYIPPKRNHADVKEVWFAGSHSDVGGGSHPTWRDRSLSFLSLRWIIKECILERTGIQFDFHYLRDALDFDFDNLKKEVDKKGLDLGEANQELEKYAKEGRSRALPGQADIRGSPKPVPDPDGVRQYMIDIVDIIFDRLILCWFWWLLEFFPLFSAYQDRKGNWISRQMMNMGRGRYIPFYENKIYVHKSVDYRIRHKEEKYTPKAYNWDKVAESPMLEYVS